jgi:hypothetical protein
LPSRRQGRWHACNLSDTNGDNRIQAMPMDSRQRSMRVASAPHYDIHLTLTRPIMPVAMSHTAMQELRRLHRAAPVNDTNEICDH